MPYIKIKTNKKVSKEEELALKGFFGKDIELVPGKSEAWLMCEIEDDRKLYFQGSDNPCAIIEVKVYNENSKIDYEPLTESLTKRVSDLLKIAENRIYIEYEETPLWGWNGNNF